MHSINSKGNRNELRCVTWRHVCETQALLLWCPPRFQSSGQVPLSRINTRTLLSVARPLCSGTKVRPRHFDSGRSMHSLPAGGL